MPSQGGSTRWCPTPEQLMILEEMYRGGLRTPNSSQIQQITAHLAFYGRIEGKNVFYWFQNHKARDRQKLRRRLCMSHHFLSCAHYYAAAAAAGHHQQQLLGTAAIAAGAPPPLCTPPPVPHYSCLDQQAAAAHLTTAPAAAYTSYYYPFGAAPASRCTAGATPSPPNPLFQYQGGGGGGVLPEAIGRPEYSLGKLDNFGVVEDTSGCPASTVVDMPPPSGYEAAMEAAGEAMSAPSTAFCRPLKTLDLFPAGLKEEQRDVV